MLQVITKREEGIERSLSMLGTVQECLILRIVLIFQASECHILCYRKSCVILYSELCGKNVMVEIIQLHFTFYTLHNLQEKDVTVVRRKFSMC